jgi:beta-lactamase class D
MPGMNFVRGLLAALGLVFAAGGVNAAERWLTEAMAEAAFEGRAGAFVMRECNSGREFVHNPDTAGRRFPPCSTFKIWNSVIGLETGVLTDPDAPFWTWDKVERSLPGWNADQTWRSAFRISCVPAFQELARKIGSDRMQEWLDKIEYGNRDIAGRPDSFWLPREGQNGVLISPEEQARLLCRLLGGKLPVAAESMVKLKDVMRLEATPQATLHGKTGSGLVRSRGHGVDYDTGWFVGFVEKDGRAYAFACLLLGPGLSGKDARGVTERILKDGGLL